MSVNIFTRATKLTNVCGRVDYATSANRQENLLATASTTQDPEFWRKLAKDSRTAFLAAGGAREIIKNGEPVKAKCCEARELVIDLPNSAMEKEDLQSLAQEITDDFKKRTGAECVVGIHLNEAKNNLHLHLIFSERELLAEPAIQIADRNAFFDEEGRRRRTKKEILGADGQLRDGCRIIPKGEVISERYFGEKNPMFADKGWLYSYKQEMADWINVRLDPDEKREVFDKYGPYLAQHHVGKGCDAEKEAAIRSWNKKVRIFNGLVKDGIIPREFALRKKQQIALAPDQLRELDCVMAGVFSTRRDLTADQRAQYDWNEAQIGKIPRTKDEDPDEIRKRKLRDAHRRGTLEWQAYRNAPEGSLERKKLLAEARKISAEISRLERELGYDRPLKTAERRQAVWDAYGDQKEVSRSDEAVDRRRRQRKDRNVAYQEYQNQLKEYQYKYRGRRTWTSVREEEKARLDDARRAYVEARNEARTEGQAYRLLQDYRSFALQLASDPNVSQADADRALDRYKAACRRLQNPSPTTVKELRRQLADLQRSQEQRRDKASLQTTKETKEPRH